MFLIYRYHLGAIRLLVAIGNRKTALKTILALGDMKLLTRPQVWGKAYNVGCVSINDC